VLGLDYLSLAALPPVAAPIGWLGQKTGAHGLCQFKTSFNPTRVPLYAAAPSSPELWFALCDLWCAIRRSNSNIAQVLHEDYEFDSIKSA
ncbi:MAG: hypothetical protein AAFY25_14550, partial [Pseudomonadota bacterium]